jgi:hypothetical protein
MTTEIIQGLDIRNSDGDAIDVVTRHYDGEWLQTVNAADLLRFRCPSADAANLVFPNEVWLRRGDSAELVRKFVITTREEREGRRDEVIITAYDYSSLLLRVFIPEFPEGDEPESGMVSTEEYLISLLLLAEETGITWGTLPEIPEGREELEYRYMHVTETNVLAALHNVRQDIGGMIWVDNGKRLHWYQQRFPDHPNYTLELDRNCIEVSRITDNITNRTDTSYKVDVVDLSAHDVTDDGMLNVGMPVKVPIPNAGTTTELYITDIKQAIDNPLALQIAVNDKLDTTGRFRDLLDYLLDPLDPGNIVRTQLDNFGDWLSQVDRWLNDWPDNTTTFDEAIEAVLEEILSDPPEDILELIDGLIEDYLDGFGGTPESVDPNASVIPLLYLGKVKELHSDGNQITVYLYDYVAADWKPTTTNINKPYYLRKDSWNAQTIEYTDGTERTYNVTDLDAKYQRRAVWEVDEVEVEEIQEITAPYAVNERLYIMQDRAGLLYDTNTAGRHWAAAIEEPEEEV